MAELKVEQRIMTFNGHSGEICAYSELLLRMAKLVEFLEPHQRNYHLCLRINIYWYIEKHKEIELLLSRLPHQSNGHLRQHLDELCVTISRRIDEDEKVASEFLNGEGQ